LTLQITINLGFLAEERLQAFLFFDTRWRSVVVTVWPLFPGVSKDRRPGGLSSALDANLRPHRKSNLDSPVVLLVAK
jgi:hypothetical protein